MKKTKSNLTGYILILLATIVLVVLIKYLVIPPAPKVKPSSTKEKKVFTTEELIEKYAGTPSAENLLKDQKIGKNIYTVTKIAEDYHKTHTYSFRDLFVCGDMAIDVWNQIKTKGVNAIIAVGNIDVPYASFEDVNHAWVLAEVEPFKWLAVETTAGRVIHGDKTPAYYQGFAVFNTPAEFKKYLELTKEYNQQLEELKKLSIYDLKYHRKIQQLRDVSNQIEGLLY